MPTVLLLPGAGGSPAFWEPVMRRLPSDWSAQTLGWPGLGDEPHDPAVASVDDLVALVERRAGSGPLDVVAQSMGGVVAARLALRHPWRVRRLVLVATSAGIDMAAFGAADWRPEYRERFPRAARWISDAPAAAPLPLEAIAAPTLLIWGDADAISPVGVGRHIASRMPRAVLRIVQGGDHDLARAKADVVARLIEEHLSRPE